MKISKLTYDFKQLRNLFTKKIPIQSYSPHCQEKIHRCLFWVSLKRGTARAAVIYNNKQTRLENEKARDTAQRGYQNQKSYTTILKKGKNWLKSQFLLPFKIFQRKTKYFSYPIRQSPKF